MSQILVTLHFGELGFCLFWFGFQIGFICTKLFQKRHTIQGGTLFKGGQYLRKNGIFYIYFVVSPTDSTISKGK